MANMKTVGIIGGSGLYTVEGLQNVRAEKIKTSWGDPSDVYIIGNLEDTTVIFLPRHGKGHVLLPSELNHRANICGFKMLGAEWIISVSAVGSLKEELRPRDIVLVDQFFDRTKRGRDFTFFGDGIVPGDTRIRIYTISGELVADLDANEGNEIIWDGKADDKTVSNGIYIYTYKSPREKGVGKFTVVQ